MRFVCVCGCALFVGYSVVNSQISGVQPIMLFFKCFTSVSIHISCANKVPRTQHAIILHISLLHIIYKRWIFFEKKKRIYQTHYRTGFAKIRFSAQTYVHKLSYFYHNNIFALIEQQLTTFFFSKNMGSYIIS